MRNLLLLGLGLCAVSALYRAEDRGPAEDDSVVPFLAALGLEIGIFILRRRQGNLLSKNAIED